MAKPKKKTNLNVRIPTDLAEALLSKAVEQDISMSDVVRQMLREFLKEKP